MATKLFGTKPNQAPLNQHLGSMAYQNKEGIAVDRIFIGNGATGGGRSTVMLRGEISQTNGGGWTFENRPTFKKDVLDGIGYYSRLNAENSAWTINNLYHFYASTEPLGANVSVTRQVGFHAEGSLTAAAENYGFRSDLGITSGKTVYAFFGAGSAPSLFSGDVIAKRALIQTPTRSTAASGTVALTTATNHLIHDTATVAASLTITLPSTTDLVDGQVITICSRSGVTALTLSSAVTGGVVGAPTTLAAGGFCSFIYSSAAGAWFRRG